jgi:methionyl-tRNA formyltransferase
VRILYLANNRLGVEVLKWLKTQNEDIIGLGIHPPTKRTFGEELLATANLPSHQILAGETLRTKQTIHLIRDMCPDLILSIQFGYILPPSILEIPKHGCVNLHPAYLPYNRGANPNVWSIVEGTPAGVTLHYMDKGVDTGQIINRKQVSVLPTDTGKTLYHKLEEISLELFQEAWPSLKAGTVECIPQSANEGTYHKTKDIDEIDRIDLNASYTGQELIDILRARTFPPYSGAYFEKDGRKIYLRLELSEEKM